jgi:sporulation protein YlmC with PRC-barrel domain
MALDIDTALSWRGKTVVDRDGEKIGKLGDVYLDRETDLPAYASVNTGLFGTQESFLLLADAEPDGDDIRVPHEKALVLDAPRIEPDVALTAHEERLLDEHYGAAPAGEPAGAVSAPEAAARDEQDAAVTGDTGATGPDAPVEVVRSEEEARFRTEQRPAERVRLKKVVVTDHVERTVPVRREEVRLEHEPPPEGRVVHEEE